MAKEGIVTATGLAHGTPGKVIAPILQQVKIVEHEKTEQVFCTFCDVFRNSLNIAQLSWSNSNINIAGSALFGVAKVGKGINV